MQQLLNAKPPGSDDDPRPSGVPARMQNDLGGNLHCLDRSALQPDQSIPKQNGEWMPEKVGKSWEILDEALCSLSCGAETLRR
jgi:hypothetical protein